jgi:hypothetical protein
MRSSKTKTRRWQFSGGTTKARGMWPPQQLQACYALSAKLLQRVPCTDRGRALFFHDWTAGCLISSASSVSLNVRFGSSTDIPRCPRRVCFTPESGHSLAAISCPLGALADIQGRSLSLVPATTSMPGDSCDSHNRHEHYSDRHGGHDASV